MARTSRSRRRSAQRSARGRGCSTPRSTRARSARPSLDRSFGKPSSRLGPSGRPYTRFTAAAARDSRDAGAPGARMPAAPARSVRYALMRMDRGGSAAETETMSPGNAKGWLSLPFAAPRLLTTVLALALAAYAAHAQTPGALVRPPANTPSDVAGALARYVAKPDDTFGWELRTRY